jgi:signal transduction histidine kinase
MPDQPSQISRQTSHPRSPFRYAIGVVLVMFASLLVFWLVMRPQLTELGYMAVYLSGTALISIALGYIAYRTGWFNRAPSLRWALLGGYVLSSLLTFLNVWITARLMFTSQHDLLLATILLIFASGIAMVLGLFLSTALTDRIRTINQAAQAVSRGELGVRIQPQGADEVADLANKFNEMTTQLQVAQKNQRMLENTRRDLIAWVSHDLQTPLASMQVITEALVDGVVTDTETVQRYLATQQKNIRDLSVLIDDLFQMTQLEAGGLALECSQASLADLLSDTLESFHAQAVQQGVDLSVGVTPGVDKVYMDTRLIGRVLNNLISNAIRHTPPGGRVNVTTERMTGRLKITISDSGEGIPSEDLPYVFDRFYRGEKSRSRSTGGAGLGLAIARGIVEAHGGEINVESSLGHGSIFWFTLPESNKPI